MKDVAMVAVKRQIPDELRQALEHAELTTDQLKLLIEIEAEQLGLTFEEAVTRARADALPHTPLGFDLQFHILMLAA
jgi:hypothetical protein